jgi:hypothetical protein
VSDTLREDLAVGTRLVAVLAAGALLVAANLPRVSFAHAGTTRIDGPRLNFLSEPEIAVDPNDPSRVLVVSKDNFALQAYSSSDGGASFTGGRAIDGSYIDAPALATDPVALFDGDGTAFFGQLVSRQLSREAAESIVGLMRSDDGGATFASPVAIARKPFEDSGGDDFGPFDKEWLAVDRTGGARDGALYAAWVRIKRGPRGTNTIRFARSLDGGATWSRPMRISSRERLALGPQVAVLPDGSVHVAWASLRREQDDRGVVVHASSRDGGLSFGRPRRVARFRNGLAAYPLVALSAAPDEARLLACWATGGRRVSRAVCAPWRRGHGWGHPRAVAPWSRGRHDLVAVAADGDRRFWVSLYATRPRHGLRVLLQRTGDGGRSFIRERTLARRPYRLATFVGDYTGLEAEGGRVFAAYVLPRRGRHSPHAIYVTSLTAP